MSSPSPFTNAGLNEVAESIRFIPPEIKFIFFLLQTVAAAFESLCRPLRFYRLTNPAVSVKVSQLISMHKVHTVYLK